jgi:anti-sigma factor RsiW
MSCRPVGEEDLHAYVDKRLEPERQTEIAAYLRDHLEVARRVAVYSAQRDLLRSALRLMADQSLPPKLRLWRIVADWHRRRRSTAGWTIMVMLLIGLGAVGGWVTQRAMRGLSDELASLAQDAAACFEVYAQDRVRPVELPVSENEKILEWLSGRLQQKMRVPDLATAGYRLLGERLIATSYGPAAMFMYDDDRGDRLIMLTRAFSVAHEEAMTPQWNREVVGFTWADNGMGYSLVGPSTVDALRLIAKEVRRQTHIG